VNESVGESNSPSKIFLSCKIQTIFTTESEVQRVEVKNALHYKNTLYLEQRFNPFAATV